MNPGTAPDNTSRASEAVVATADQPTLVIAISADDVAPSAWVLGCGTQERRDRLRFTLESLTPECNAALQTLLAVERDYAADRAAFRDEARALLDRLFPEPKGRA